MRASLSQRALSVVLLVSFGVTCAAAGSQAVADQYKPQVGQDGKDVVWVPSPDPLVDTMLDMAQVTANDFVMDLGSGDGRTVIAAARRGARAVGVEYNPDMVALSRRNAAAANVGNKTEFVQADLFETDLSKATVITMFLLPQINLKLRPKILELKPGTRIVSNTFTMDDWKADETKTVSADCTSYCTALLWIVPARVDGVWKLPQGQLALKQTFQTLSGTLTTDGKAVPIEDGKMSGATINFKAGGASYTGLVANSAIEGTVTSGGNQTAWRAAK